MRVKLNDKEVQLDSPQSLFKLLEDNKLEQKAGIAVAINNTIIPKSKWNEHSLQDNDSIVVITATAGG